MPVLQFTKADILRSQNLENEKWYSWQVTSVTGPVPNANRDGLNLVIVSTLIDTNSDIDGKEVSKTFSLSSKGKSHQAMMIPFVAACTGKKVDDLDKEGFQFDTDDLKGAKYDGKYTLETYNGQLIGKVDQYLPYKSAAGQTPGF